MVLWHYVAFTIVILLVGSLAATLLAYLTLAFLIYSVIKLALESFACIKCWTMAIIALLMYLAAEFTTTFAVLLIVALLWVNYAIGRIEDLDHKKKREYKGHW